MRHPKRLCAERLKFILCFKCCNCSGVFFFYLWLSVSHALEKERLECLGQQCPVADIEMFILVGKRDDRMNLSHMIGEENLN